MQKVFSYKVVFDDAFSSRFPQKAEGASWMEWWPKWVGSLYGARDAPMIWQDCLRGHMKLLGFIESLRAPCMFYHATNDVEMIPHVDDLFVVGCLKDVQGVYRGLADAFEMKCTYAGPKTGNSEVEAAHGFH